MAIAVDLTSSTTGANVTSVTAQHICTGTATNGILIIAVQSSDGTAAERIISTVTHNDETCSHLAADSDDGTSLRTEIWYRLNPTAGGTPSIIVTAAGKCTDLSYGAISLTGVNSASAPAELQAGSGSSTAPSISITTVGTSSYAIDSMAIAEATGTTIAAVHTAIHKTDVGADVHGSQYVDAGGAGAQTMNYTDSSPSASWVMYAVAVQVASAGP